MRRLLRLLLLVGLAFALVGCSSGESDAALPSDQDAVAGNDTSTDNPEPGASGVTVDGPNGYTLQVEEFADIVSWSYQATGVSAKVCGNLDADRTLTIYRSTLSPTADVLCDQGGGTILNLQAGREIEQPDEDGAIESLDGDVGTIVAGGETFGKSAPGTVGVEVRNPTDASIAPATVYLEITANSGNISLTFSGTP